MKKLFYPFLSAFLPMAALIVAGVAGSGARAGGAEFSAAGFTNGPSTPFPRMKGRYNGLAMPAGAFIPEYSGYFTFSIDSDRYFDGWLDVGDRTVSLWGRFDNQGSAGVSIYDEHWDGCCYYYLELVWIVELQLVLDTDEIQGTAVNVRHGYTTDLFGYRAYGKPDYPAPQKGRYTLRLPSNADPTIAPAGEGYGLVKVDSHGRVSMYGALADGTAYSRSAAISTNGWWPFYFPFNDGKGALIGWLQFGSLPGSDVAGDLIWVKPQNDDRKFYPAGFSGTIAASGSRYVDPGSRGLALSWTNGLFRILGGNLSAPAMNNITLSAGGKLTDNGGGIAKLKFSLSRGTGKISGKFTHPESGASTSYTGVLDQLQDLGAGYFLGTDQGGLVRLESAP